MHKDVSYILLSEEQINEKVKELANIIKKDFEGKNVKYHIEFFRSGINSIIKMWLNDGCKESPEEMTEILKEEYKGR